MRKIIKTILTVALTICTINVIHAVNISEMEFPYSLDRSTWTAVANSYQYQSGDNDGPASNLLDGNTGTTWHSAYQDGAAADVREFPFYVKIKFSDDFTKTETFSAFKYITRQGSADNGNIAGYELYISNANEDLDFTSSSWQLIHTGSFSGKENEVDLGQMYSATQIQLKAISSQNGNVFAGGSEFELYRDEMNIVPIPSSDMTIDVSGTNEGNKDNLFDNNDTSFWTSEDGGNLNADFLKITLTNETVINQIDFTDRYDNGTNTQWKCTGNMRNYIIQVSLTGEDGDWKVVSAGKTFDDEKYTSKGDGGTTRVKFAPVLAKYIKITCTESYHWENHNQNKFMTISELDVYGASSHMAKPSEPVMTYVNVARGKTVTALNSDGSEPGGNGQRPLSMITDGTINMNNYGELGRDNNRVSKYIQIDLEKVYTTIKKLHMHRYWDSNRIYDATVIQVAESLDESGNLNNPVTIFNSDSNNAHGLSNLPEAVGLYGETSDGKEFVVPENTPIQYIRVYVYGVKDGGTTDHIVELQAIAENIEKYNSDLAAYKEAEKKYYGKADVIYGFESDYAGYVRESRYSSVAPASITPEEVEANEQKEAVLSADGSFIKYVTDKVLSVRVQTYSENGKIYAKFVSSVPSLNLNKVKFKVQTSNSVVQEKESNKVYTELNTNYGTDITTPTEAFNNEASEYFFTLKLNGIPNDYAGTITVTPCWQPHEEEVWVEGVSRTFKVSENKLVDAE